MASRRTVILTADGNPLVELEAQNITDDGNGVITIEVDTLETPVTIGTGNVQLRDNSSVLEFSIDGGSNWDIVPANDEVIHNNASAEISTITEKTSPVGADLVLIEDSAASNAKKRVQITNLPGGADSDAIHDNVSAEISAITEKVSPVGADLVLIEDSAASNAKKKVQITNLPGGADSDAIHDNVSAEISAVTEKASPVGADLLLIEDSAASNAKKRVQITNLPTGADSDAIHDNVSAEISAVTEKASPVSADLVIIEDSEAANVKKRVQVGNLPGGSGTDDDAIHDNVSAEISAVTEKTTPIGADLLLIEDSAAANAKKRIQLSNLPADPDAIHDNVSAEISTITEKASPVGADLVLIEDSEAANVKKRVQITNLPGGTDSDAIHDNVSAEISAVTEKASPVGADLLLIEDSAASNAKKRVQITNLPTGSDTDAIHDNVSAEISAITEKTSPVAADLLLIEDSESSNAKKRVQITNLPVSGSGGLSYLGEWDASTNTPEIGAYDAGSNEITFTDTLPAGSTSDLAGTQYRIAIPGTELSYDGDRCRIIIEAGAVGAYIAKAYIGEKASSGNAWDFAGTQVQVTFDGGSTTVSISADAKETSDWVTCPIDTDKTYIFAFDTVSGNTCRVDYNDSTNCIAYYKATATLESHITQPTGYSTQASRNYGIDSIEIQTLDEPQNPGDYYKVIVAGSTELSSIVDWGVDDFVLYSAAGWQKIDNSIIVPITTTITGTTYQPTGLQCADLTVLCKTGSNTIELTDPATGDPGSVKVYALDTQTLTVTGTTINELGSTGTQYQNNDVAYEWAWFIYDHSGSQWFVFQESGTWTLSTP